MPPYTSRKTSLHPSEPNFQAERPRKPQIWDRTHCSTKPYAEPTLCPSTTMEFRMTMAKHDTTLPTPYFTPTVSGSPPWQHNHTEIANGMVRTGASQQHDPQYGMQTTNDELQLPATLPHDKSKYQGHTGYHDNSQLQIPGGKPTHLNTITQNVTPTPTLTHAGITTPFYKTKSEKVTLQLPQQQSNPTATGTIDSTTIYYH